MGARREASSGRAGGARNFSSPVSYFPRHICNTRVVFINVVGYCGGSLFFFAKNFFANIADKIK